MKTALISWRGGEGEEEARARRVQAQCAGAQTLRERDRL